MAPPVKLPRMWDVCGSSKAQEVAAGVLGVLLSLDNPSSSSSSRSSRRTLAPQASREANEPHATSVAPSLSEGLLAERGGSPAAAVAELDDADVEDLLATKLPDHPKLYRGVLGNGLRYTILPNRVPPNRFEAHLEMHVGSVDEAEGEQGVAHMIEHVTFLGSKKREKLLGTGARSNAYTDFHHTVFHVHAPVTTQGSNEPLLPLVLEALHEIAFCPKFLPSRIEKERRAVLSELQMMNTIEYRVDCQLLQQLHSENLLSKRFPIGLEEQIHKWDADTIRAFHERWYFPANATLFVVGDIGSVGRTIEMIELLQQLHSENLLSKRFPIGLEEQIHKWDADTIRAFHERWYFPANATLFVVGDIGSVGRTIEMIEAQFGSTPAGIHDVPSTSLPLPPVSISPPKPPPSPKSFFQSPFSLLSPSLSTNDAKNKDKDKDSKAPAPPTLPPLPPPVLKERHKLRPPVEHRWSTQNMRFAKSGYPAPGGMQITPHVFQHELLQNFSMSIFCKTPVRPVVTFGDLRNVLMQRIALSTLQFRINTRYKSANPPFLGVELDHSDSGREGCAVSTLTVTSEPRHWQGAVQVGCQEVRRLKEFGVTRGEMARYLTALLKDSEQLAAMIDSIPSVDNLDFIMESDALGHTVMDQQQGYEALAAVAQTVTLEEVNAAAATLLAYIAEFGREDAPVPAAIVACVPATIHDPSGSGVDLPFQVSLDDIRAAILEGLSAPTAPEPEVEVPKSLISGFEMAKMKFRSRPSFVAVDTSGGPTRRYDEATGIIQRRLSNGVRVNMKITQNEAKGGVLRVVAPGGRAREDPNCGGAVAIGVRTLSEGGTVGGFSREQVELFCVGNLINCVLEADEEFVCMDFHFTLRDGGLTATFQLLHMVLEQAVWLEDALDRAKQLYLSHFRAMPKSLERATAHRLMSAMFGSDQRLVEPSPDAIAQLTLPRVREAVLAQLLSGSLEVSLVGDFTEEEVDRGLLDYVGTISLPKSSSASKDADAQLEKPVVIQSVADPALQHQRVMLRDTDERACAYIAGAAPNRWGFTADGRDLNTIMDPVPPNLTEEQARKLAPPFVELVAQDGQPAAVAREGGEQQPPSMFWQRRRHPLYASVSMALLAEIVNARLFTTVRDALGLTYDVSFELSLFDRLRTGWFVIAVTSTPAKIDQAVDASLNVLRGLHGNRVNQRELDRVLTRAKRTLRLRHESDLKDNTHWLGLLTHVQSDVVPRKDVGCIRDLPYLYEVATADDVYNAYNHLSLDDDSVFTCIGTAGAQASAAAGDTVIVVEPESEPEDAGALQVPQMHGRGSSLMTRPTE
eukprot:jgi/Mesen1/2708/ME000168S01777